MSPLSLSPAFQPLLTAWDAWLLTLLMGIAFPVYVYFRLYRRLRDAPADMATAARRRIYRVGVLAEWLLVAGLAFVAYRHHLSLVDLGQHLVHPRRILGVTVCLAAAFGILVAQNLWQLRRTAPEDLAVQLGRARKIFPIGKRELLAWALVSLTAGICEELLFRGWMLNFLGRATGSVWIGLALSSLLFGLAHTYQGAKGILATGLVGLVLGLVYIAVGSLVPGQILHALVDLVNGFIGASLLTRMRSLPNGAQGQGLPAV